MHRTKYVLPSILQLGGYVFRQQCSVDVHDLLCTIVVHNSCILFPLSNIFIPTHPPIYLLTHQRNPPTHLPTIYLSIYLPSYLNYQPMYVPTYIFTYAYLNLPICLPVCQPTYLPAYLLPACLPTYLSTYLPACLPA